MLALGCTDALVWRGHLCNLRAVDQHQLRLCHFVCLSEVWTLSGRDTVAALEIRETGSLFKALKDFAFFSPAVSGCQEPALVLGVDSSL